MIKYILLAVVAWALPCAMAHAGDTSPIETQVQSTPIPTWDDIVKESIDATHAPDMELNLTGDPVPSDLTLDLDFAGNGMRTIFPFPKPAGATLHQDGLRVFPYTTCTGTFPVFCFHSGYYLVGRIRNTDSSFHSAIARIKMDGSTDTTFGTDGWVYPLSNARAVVDAAMGSDRMYILSTINLAGIPMMRVTCTVLATGNNCSGFFAVTSFHATADGAVRGAWAQRIVYDNRYGLFVAGRVKTVARGWEIAVARLDADTGVLVAEFHGDGMNTGLPSWAAQANSDINVYDMAVVPVGAPGGERLYIAGTIKRSAIDYDGFVLGLNPNSGYSSTGWSWQDVYYESDNYGFKKDAVTAITVQRNGRLAMAGWSETDTVNERSMILARFNADGTRDYSFCDDAWVCKRNAPWPGVVDNDWPAAIAERDGNRDLVVAFMHRRPVASDPRERQVIFQYSANGNVRHANRTLDYPAGAGVTPWSRPYGMWVGHTGVFGLGGEVIAIVGTRKYNDNSEDFTLGHLIANDSIFADQFGGPHND